MKTAKTEGMILVVDHDRHARNLLRSSLARHFDVVTAATGREALARFEAIVPDLVLIDAQIPDLDGYAVCQKIRENSRVPIIFVTASTSLEDHLRAYDSGGTGLLTKPVNGEFLLRKVTAAIEIYREARRSERERQELQRMAMSFLSSAGQTGALLNFMRQAIAAPTYEQLAEGLLAATASLDLNCVVRIEHGGDSTVRAFHGEPTLLELSILEHASGMGRIFQFKNRLVVNYERITVVVSNTAEDPESSEAGMVRDNVAILAETAQALAENIDLRRAAAHQAEQMQLALASAERALSQLSSNQHEALADVQILLHGLVEGVERSYGWLNTTQAQETEISRQMNDSVQKILARLGSETNFEQPLQLVIAALRQGYDRPDSVELF